MQNIQLRRELISLAGNLIKQNPKDFDELMICRLKWAETEPLRPGLVLLEDKLWQRHLANNADVQCPELFASFGSNAKSGDIVDALCRLCRPAIMKPTHLLAGLGVVFVSPSGNISFPKPSRPGYIQMKTWQNKYKNILKSKKIDQLKKELQDEKSLMGRYTKQANNL